MTRFWDTLLQEDQAAIYDEFIERWHVVYTTGDALNAQFAAQTLELLFKRSHLALHKMGFADVYPTTQGGPWHGLDGIKHLWWLDHATAGISGRGTLEWFSSRVRPHTVYLSTEREARAHYGFRKPGAQLTQTPKKKKPWMLTWTGPAGAVTHFVVFFDGTPFYVVKTNHCVWGEPKRNRDSIQVEMVNALVCQQKRSVTRVKPQWHFWAGPIPSALLDQGLTPVALKLPFRGAWHMMPYTRQQILANIALKRLCVAATEGRMSPDRMSHHTDWAASKFDMGPLWPRQLVDAAAFDTTPLEALQLPENLVDFSDADTWRTPVVGETYVQEGNVKVPLCDDTAIQNTKEIQRMLVVLYGADILSNSGVDGVLGAETGDAVKQFQRDWSYLFPYDVLDVDGIPGVETRNRLTRATTKESFFVSYASKEQ